MPNKPLLAFDVGGTTIKYALLTPELTLEQTGSVPTNKNKDGQILKKKFYFRVNAYLGKVICNK